MASADIYTAIMISILMGFQLVGTARAMRAKARAKAKPDVMTERARGLLPD